MTLGANGQSVTGGTGADTLNVEGRTTTGTFALGSGSNKVIAASGAALNNSISATGGTAALELATNASITLSAANYSLFNIGGIAAAGAETITFSDAVVGQTLNAAVETFVLANATNSVTLGADGQLIDARSVTDGTALELDATAYDGTVLVGSGDLYAAGTGDLTVTVSGAAGSAIWGGAGADTITGGAGNDVIWAGQGADVVTGGGGTDAFIVVGALSSSESEKITAINASIASLTGKDPGLDATRNFSDVGVGESFSFNDAGNDTLYVFGDVDFSGTSLTSANGYQIVTLSNVTLRQDQLAQVKSITWTGDFAHSLTVTQSDGSAMDAVDQKAAIEGWLNSTGKQMRFDGSLSVDLAGESVNARGLANFTEEFSLLDIPASSSALTVDLDGDGVFDDELTAQHATASSLITSGAKVINLVEVSYQVGQVIEAPLTFNNFGDDMVHDNQFEVYYGTYDNGVFTVTSTPRSAGGTDLSNVTHTMVLYDNDPENTVSFVEGFVLTGLYAEHQWTVANGAMSFSNDLNTSYPSSEHAIYSTSDGQTVVGGDGNDILYAKHSGVTLAGSAGNDILFGGSGGDTIYDGTGTDVIRTGAGADTIFLTLSSQEGTNPKDYIVYDVTFVASRQTVADSPAFGATAEYDTITNFNTSDDDVIFFSGFDTGGRKMDGNPGSSQTGTINGETGSLPDGEEINSQASILIVTDSTVSSGSDLASGIASALDAAFNLSTLGNGQELIFVVKGSQTHEYWVGLYENIDLNDANGASEIQVVAQVFTEGDGVLDYDNILTSTSIPEI